MPPGRAAIEMAHHWHAAHDTVWALIGAWQAAAQAGRAVAPAERLSLLARVLELWDQVPDAADRIGADHVRVLEEATSAANEAGEFERGVALASSALKELDPAADPVRVARLLENRGYFKMNLGRQDYPDDFSVALQTVPADAAEARVSILLSAARCIPHAPTESSYAEEALALARQLGDEAKEANALLTLAMFQAGAGQESSAGSDPIGLIAQARAMAERVGAYDLVAKAAVNESHLLEGAGEHELAVAAARRGWPTRTCSTCPALAQPAHDQPVDLPQHELAVAAARRGLAHQDVQYLSRTSRSLLTINQVEPLLALGRWDEALALAEAARDFQLAALPLHRAILQVMKARIALARGQAEVCAQALSAASGILRGSPHEDQHHLPMSAAQIALRLSMAGPAAAVGTAAQLIDDYPLDSPRYAWPLLAAAADAALAAARQAAAAQDERLRDEAAALADRLRAFAEKLETFGPAQRASRLTFAATDAQVAFVLGARGDGPQAAWDEAAAAWAAVGEPYPLAQALLHAAETAITGGDRDAAADRLRQAAELAGQLGAGPLGEQISALARRARISLGGGDSGAGDYGLTGRELDVLRLVAAGRSNREIAAELFISPKTASVHVSNILGKLGAASRGEAAAQAHALRLLEPA